MLDQIPLFSLLKQKLSWSSARQSVLAQNVANSHTPGYEARDLKPFTFQDVMSKSGGRSAHLATTHSHHVQQSRHAAGGHKLQGEAGIWETTPDGNSVVLEQQMFKMSQNQMEFQSALSVYKKSVSLLKMAVSRGGK